MPESFNMQELMDSYAIPWAINIAMALAIFVIGRWIAGILLNLLDKILNKAGMDVMLVGFVHSILNALLLLFIIIASLDQLGVNTTSFIALIGAAGLAVGLALQGSLQNFASGVLLIVFHPFRVGHFIEAGGASGVVEEIGIFSTRMKTGDNREIIVPNGAIYGGTITNNSARATRRIDMVFGIGYDDDIKKAKEIMQSILEADERILKEPAPLIAVAELGDSSVNFAVRPWVNSGDYWGVKFDVTEKIKLAFDTAGISIPYPQMDVHISKPE
ncbi:MAG: mechanosensitive ion channel protein MscS [Zetaproteobacteria bacterium CG12_big_fil_rev_8_21_14_0_65_54_13]|nr:MAG: mechanosensitive ion channel protein MscS [Zetaproteobacteria bacterium CG23_combo_of_CG06-09_8_20_14_all_54_7]PIW50755.1 MAG: mechanosensitive ion channel protein MscS [Zetaproteobacteria bacterium CG12_big_fil_rev_8_21_14_0_65_54_13]